MGQSMFACCWQYLENREKFMFQDKNSNSKREILYELQDTALIEKKRGVICRRICTISCFCFKNPTFIKYNYIFQHM